MTSETHQWPENQRLKLVRIGIVFAAAALALTCLPALARAAVVDCPGSGSCTVSNPFATIGTDSNSPDELDDWIFNGQDHLFSTRWAVRTGGVTDTLPTPSSATANDVTDTLAITTETDEFRFLITYVLGSDGMTISESVTLTNLTTAAANYRVFATTDFDLAGVSGGQFGRFDATTRTFSQTDPSQPGLTATWTANDPISGWQMGQPSLAGLESLTNSSSPIGPADVSFAFSFDTNIAPQQSATFSLTKAIAVPEPSSNLILGFIAMLTVAAPGRSRGKRASRNKHSKRIAKY
ncbi:MAG: hypothetical protein AAF802_13250 [Planctomycetota bacterium]